MHVKALRFVLIFCLFLGVTTLIGIVVSVVSDKITFGDGFLGFLVTTIICLLLSSATQALKGPARAADQDVPRDR